MKEILKILIEAVKTLKEANPSDEGIQNWVNDNVPELQESDDERIINWLIRTLKSLNSTAVQIDGAYEMMLPAIAWLEKQGEQIDIANKEYWRGYREGKKEILDKYAELETQGKQRYINALTPQEAMDIAVSKCFEEDEQKPAWNEEDEKNLQILQKIICDSDMTANLANKLSNWLISLRIQSTWKPSAEQVEELRKHSDNVILRNLYYSLKKLK